MPRALRQLVLQAVVVLAAAAPLEARQDVRAVVCPAIDRAPHEVAAFVTSLGPAAPAALLLLADGATPADVHCGLAGLAAIRDRRVVPRLVRAIEAAPAGPDVWRYTRWAAFVAGGPDPTLGAPFASVLPLLDTPAARAAAGEDRLRLLGELESAEARTRLVAALDAPLRDADIDAAIHALARQREPRARARVTALGAEVAAGLAGNATYEQARRLGAVAFYLLVVADDAVVEGRAHLARLSPRDQADTVAWAAQTLCEVGVRHPDARGEAAARWTVVVSAAVGIAWTGLVRGTFPCDIP